VQSHELLREVFQTTSAKQVAADLGLSLSLVYKWTEPPQGDAGGPSNPLERAAQLMATTDDHRVIDWLCSKAGGFFVRNPATHNNHPDRLIPATNKVVQDFADLLSVIAAAGADNSITGEESKQIRRRWEELKTATETFVACCEQGNFTRVNAVTEAQRAPGKPARA
jgi:hypothetical protein